jgi:hypothetical protein
MKKSTFEQTDLKKRDEEQKVSIDILYKCTQCGQSLCYEEDIRENFCPRCGQRLSWADVDHAFFTLTEHGLEPYWEDVE